MNTKDVFNYFQEFAAGGIEWIDDESCKYCRMILYVLDGR